MKNKTCTLWNDRGKFVNEWLPESAGKGGGPLLPLDEGLGGSETVQLCINTSTDIITTSVKCLAVYIVMKVFKLGIQGIHDFDTSKSKVWKMDR